VLTECDVAVCHREKKMKPFCISIFTRDRQYFLRADDETEMKKWIAAIRAVISQSEQRVLFDFKSD